MQSYKSIVVRASALAAMLGGVLWSAKAFYDMNDAPPWPTDVTDDLFFVVLVFFLAGLSGLYARCRGGLGEWETISPMGFVASLVGLTVSIVGQLTMVLEVGPSWWLGISWWMFVFGFLRYESHSGVPGQLDRTERGAAPMEGRAASDRIIRDLAHSRG
jgi:hypothetical protein